MVPTVEELDYLITYNIFDETNTFQNFGFNKPWKQEPQRASSYVPTMEEISTCRASDSLPLLVGGGYEAAPLYPSNFSPAKQSAEPYYTSNSMPTPASPDAPYPAFHGMAEFTTMPQPQIDGYNFPIISPKPSVPYPPPQPITDDKCSLRRKKNNEASKISRDKRRKKVKGLEVREAELVAENQSLRSVVQELETEIAVIREKLLQKLIRPQA